MSTYAADDHEAIRRRLEELAAEHNLALTGSTVAEKVGEYAAGWPVIKDVNAPLDSPQIYGGYDYDPA